MGTDVKIRNIVFSAIACALLMGPLVLFCLQDLAKVDLPANITSESATYLTGGVVKAEVRKNMSLHGFASGELQSSLEDKVGNYVPCKSFALLWNAGLQRSAIACSDALFGWKCYPTYYGSTKLYDSSHNALFEMPMLNESRIISPDALAKNLSSFGRGLASVAAQYPEKHIYVLVADRSSTSLANPARHLVSSSETMSTDECAGILANETSGLENIAVIARTYSDVEDYLGSFYPTDHHWNGFGAIDAARSIPASPSGDTESLEAEERDVEQFGSLVFNGTLSRRGLMCLNLGVEEPHFSTGTLSVDEASEAHFGGMLGLVAPADLVKSGLRAEYDFYSLWYGGDRACEIRNSALDATQSALLISDSYGDAFRWVLAEQYGTVIGTMDLKKSEYSVDELSRVIGDSECEDVYIVGWAGGFHELA